MPIAKRYQVKLLLQKCEDVLLKNISTENCADILMMANTHDALLLKKDASDYFRLHSGEVIKTAGWQSLRQTQPQLGFEVCEITAASIWCDMCCNIPSYQNSSFPIRSVPTAVYNHLSLSLWSLFLYFNQAVLCWNNHNPQLFNIDYLVSFCCQISEILMFIHNTKNWKCVETCWSEQFFLTLESSCLNFSHS